MSDPIYLAYVEVENYDGYTTRRIIKLDRNSEIFAPEVINTAKKIVKHIYEETQNISLCSYLLHDLFNISLQAANMAIEYCVQEYT